MVRHDFAVCRHLASTGPRLRERGKLFERPEHIVLGWASTGPRLRERGKECLNAGVHRRASRLQRGRAYVSAERLQVDNPIGLGKMLQRGRAPVSAERFCASVGETITYWLQRGRAYVSAESTGPVRATGRGQHASTGPRSRERGKSRQPGQSGPRNARFNGAALT